MADKVKAPEPLLKTPVSELNAIERFKLNSNGVQGELHGEFRDLKRDDVSDETEQIAKSHGIYLEYNRAKTGREKDWMYMVRITIPGGGPLDSRQWSVLNDLSSRFTASPDGGPSLRLTTRQNIQFHWIKKQHLVELVRTVAKTGFLTLNGCGDNTRNVMGCPLSRFSDIYNAHDMAGRVGRYFQLPVEPHIRIFEIDPNLVREEDTRFQYGPGLLNRKFKIAFSAVHRDPITCRLLYDNCVELRTNDVGVSPVIENDGVVGFQVYIGGGQGEKNGKPTFARLGLPLGLFSPDALLAGLDAVVKVHNEWGDRKHRHWARLKYVVHKQGIGWYQDRVRERGVTFEPPLDGFDPGPRMLHHGWQYQPTNGKWSYGLFIENGRIIDRVDLPLREMVKQLVETYESELLITPNQDLLFANIDAEAKEAFESDLRGYRYGSRNGRPYSRLRMQSGACVGLPTCRLSYTESEQFEPELLDDLESRGYGDVAESIGITGCERQCFRPGTKSIGWIGQGPDLYMLKLGGSEDGRHQGTALVHCGRLYFRQVPRNQVAEVTASLFDLWQREGTGGEDLGTFLRRYGTEKIIGYFRNHPTLAVLTEKTWNPPYLPDGCATDVGTA